MDTSQNNQAEKINEFDGEELLKWILEDHKKTFKDDEQVEKFRAADIDGATFLEHADQVEYFQKNCDLPIGPCERLARLARTIMGPETAGAKSKSLSFIPST
jgi:hypothetical protein